MVERPRRFFSYGGGVQSTAVMVLAARQQVQYDFFVFANVGNDSESPGTLKFVEEIAKPYAREHGIKLRTVQRAYASKEAYPTLYRVLTDNDRAGVPIPVYGSETGAPWKRACTHSWKIEPLIAYCRYWGATKEQPATVGLGISVDEMQRAKSDSGTPYQVLEYPLLDLNLTRQDCINIIESEGMPVPPKSSCWFCPFHSRREWERIRREEPATFAQAVDLEIRLNERQVAQGKGKVYLTPTKRPLDEAVNDQCSLFGNDCDSGYCFT